MLLPGWKEKDADLIVVLGIEQVDKSFSLQTRSAAVKTYMQPRFTTVTPAAQ